MDKSYNHICDIAKSCKAPSLSVIPIASMRVEDNGIVTESVKLKIEARDINGTYVRSFTDRTLMYGVV